MNAHAKRLRARLRLVLLAALAVGIPSMVLPELELFSAHALSPFPISSSPIVLNNGDRFVWSVNPDNNTVSVIDVSSDAAQKVQEIPVGREPQSVALNADNSKAYVANAVDGTVSVIQTSNFTVIKTINVGAEPWALAFTPNGSKLYVANSSSNSVSVINPANDTVVKTIENVGVCPRAIAITNNGDFSDDDEKVYVTNFLAQYRIGQVRPMDDAGKVGLVYVIRVDRDAVFTTIELQPLADTGFKSDGDALNKIAPTGSATVTTGAFPNILSGLSIVGDRLYVPATGSSPNGPVKFNVAIQSLVSVVDIDQDRDTGNTVNLNRGIQFLPEREDAQGRPLKRFVSNPYVIAFRHNSNSGYVVASAADMIFKVDLDGTGKPTINAPTGAGQPDNVVRLAVGGNPRAMVINTNDTRGYVWNYVSRDVTIVDLTQDRVVNTVKSANQPTDLSDQIVQRGKELFNTGVGPVAFNPDVNAKEGVMADHAWFACSSCHPNGLTDGVVWGFGSGARFTIPLNGSIDKNDPTRHRALNWSGIFDEIADFESNTRGTEGGRGLINLANGQPDPNVKNFDPPSAGRSGDRDSITAWVQTVRSPISPISDNDPQAKKGRKVFQQAGCIQCHGTTLWTSSTVAFQPPPPANELTIEQGVPQLTGQLRQVGTFNPALPFEVIGTGGNISKQGLGQLGFNPPSLLGVFAFAPYLHNGTALTLDEVLNNPAHVGTSPILNKAKKRAALVRFLKSIDDSTVPFP